MIVCGSVKYICPTPRVVNLDWTYLLHFGNSFGRCDHVLRQFLNEFPMLDAFKSFPHVRCQLLTRGVPSGVVGGPGRGSPPGPGSCTQHGKTQDVEAWSWW